MKQETAYIAFASDRQITQGPAAQVLPVLKARFDADDSDMVLVFEVESGKQVDFDLRGSLDQVLERCAQASCPRPAQPGVSSREVALLGRHWEWLEEQPQGVSGTIRRLIEAAMKAEPEKARMRQTRDALSRFITAIAGNFPGYEEASRALFAGDMAQFETLVQAWPKDIRDFAILKARQAFQAE